MLEVLAILVAIVMILGVGIMALMDKDEDSEEKSGTHQQPTEKDSFSTERTGSQRGTSR